MFLRLAHKTRCFHGRCLLRPKKSAQTRQMGGGGGYMETNPLGRQIGELFGTIAWLWVFHRFSQDGAVLLGYQHPWEHGEHGHDAGQIDMKPRASHEQVTASWEKFSTTSIIPGDDDDEDEDDEEEDDDEE